MVGYTVRTVSHFPASLLFKLPPHLINHQSNWEPLSPHLGNHQSNWTLTIGQRGNKILNCMRQEVYGPPLNVGKTTEHSKKRWPALLQGETTSSERFPQ